MKKVKEKSGFPCPCCGRYVVSVEAVRLDDRVVFVCGECALEHTGHFMASPFEFEGNVVTKCNKGHILTKPGAMYAWRLDCPECEAHPSAVDKKYGDG